MSERYCKRCGEDAHEFIICDECGDEFCTDCGTASEVLAETCSRCINTQVILMDARSKRLPMSNTAKQLREISERMRGRCLSIDGEARTVSFAADELDRYREALEKIANRRCGTWGPSINDYEEIARAALEEK